jgi:prefoldin subunit 5
MPGPTTEVLNEDLKELKGDLHQVAVKLADLSAEVRMTIGLARWAGVFLVTYGAAGICWAASLSSDVRVLAGRADKLETRMEKVEIAVVRLESRMDELDARMDKLESRMDKLDTRMDKLESRFDKFESLLTKLVEQTRPGLPIPRSDGRAEALPK